MFSWDEKKREANKAKHGVDFTEADAFEFETALIATDDRFDYGEVREIALGKIGGAGPRSGFHAPRQRSSRYQLTQGERQRGIEI